MCEARFNDPCFLFAFLPIALVGYWLVASQRWRMGWLAAAGLVFYSFWDVRFAGLLLLSAAVDYKIALGLSRSERKKAWLVSSIAFNVGLLFVFKYAMFTVESARSLFDLIGAPIKLPYFSIVLPIGISFFVFKALSYIIDVYRGNVTPTRDPVEYLAFIALFPDLVAGPIVRFRDLHPQFAALPRWPPGDALATGALFLAVGLAKKVLVADTLARIVDPLWDSTGSLTAPEAWIAMVGYGLQLYFDFSGTATWRSALARCSACASLSTSTPPTKR